MLSMQDWYGSKCSINEKTEDCISRENEPVPRKMLKQSTLVSADTPATMNAKLEKQIGRYFVASNTAFRQVEKRNSLELIGGWHEKS